MFSEIDFRILLDSIEAKANGTFSAIHCQLRPMAWLRHLGHEGIWDKDAHYILDGVVNGFYVLNRSTDVESNNSNNCLVLSRVLKIYYLHSLMLKLVRVNCLSLMISQNVL